MLCDASERRVVLVVLLVHLVLDVNHQKKLKTVREQRLAQVLTSRFRKEHDQTIIYSSYLQTLASVLVCCAQVRSLMKKCVVFTGQNFSSAQTVSATGPRAETNADSDAGANDEKIALLQPIPEIVVDDIGINSVSLAASDAAMMSSLDAPF